MKKILTTIICLGICTAPCMACEKRPPRGMQQPPRIEKNYRYDYHQVPHYERNRSGATVAFATVAGIAGLAAIITAIAD